MMMITSKDRKQFDRLLEKKGAVTQNVFLCAALFEACIAGLHLYLMGRWGHWGGYSFAQTLRLVTGDFALDQSYAGFLFHANDALYMSFAHLCPAVAFVGNWWQRRRAREQAQRIVNSLKQAGAW